MNAGSWKQQIEIVAAGGDFAIGSIVDLPETGMIDASRLPRLKNVFDMLGVPPAEMTQFREAYDQPDARKKRRAAIVGIQEQADTELGNLITEAATYHDRTTTGFCDLDIAGVLAMRIAEQLAAPGAGMKSSSNSCDPAASSSSHSCSGARLESPRAEFVDDGAEGGVVQGAETHYADGLQGAGVEGGLDGAGFLRAGDDEVDAGADVGDHGRGSVVSW